MSAVRTTRVSMLCLLALVLSATAPAMADDQADAKAAISAQVDLIKAGDVDKLKATFTDRQKDKITKEIIEKAKGNLEKMTLEDLVASVEVAEDAGKKSAKIKMKNGRTLTTLLLTDGKWLADTIWLK